MITHKETMLSDGRLVRVISDDSLRRFNVASTQLFQEGFKKLVPNPTDLPEINYEFVKMVSEEKAMRRYEELIKN